MSPAAPLPGQAGVGHSTPCGSSGCVTTPTLPGTRRWGPPQRRFTALLAPTPRFPRASPVFLMRQFMHSVPNELLDAGRIDGLGEFGPFWRVALPLVRPAVAALCILTFLGNWNAFLWPLIVTQDPLMRTLPVGLAQFSYGEAGSRWELIMTGASIATIPVLIVFAVFQRQIIRGVALTGLKG